MKNSLLAFFLIAFGAFASYLFEWWKAGIPTSGATLTVPKQVKFGKLNEKDSWVNDFDVKFVTLGTLESKRDYALIILVKKDSSLTKSYSSERNSRFVLMDLTQPEKKLFFGINPSQISDDHNRIFSLVLDFGGNLLNREKVELSDSLELSSPNL